MTTETRTFAVLVTNEPGVLARVIGLFSGRGYNIESLTVSEIDRESKLSRITIVTSGTPQILEQIKAQLDRLVPIHKVSDLTDEADPIERELVLAKVAATGEKRVESIRLAEVMGATVIDAGLDYFTFQLTGRSREVDRFIALMRPLGLVELSRTGVVAIARGPESL